MIPDPIDLQQVYRAVDPRQAGHARAEAVCAGLEGITVLHTSNPRGDGEHSILTRLSGSGEPVWHMNYEVQQGAGRALAGTADGFVIAGDIRVGAMDYQGSLLRVDDAGRLLASARAGRGGPTGLVSIAVLSQGAILAGGTAQFKGWMVRADGGLLATHDFLLDDVDDVYGLTASSSEDEAVAVACRGASTTELGRVRVIALSADGARRWQSDLPLVGQGELTAVAGDTVAAGHRAVRRGDAARLWVVGLDGAGTLRWERLLGSAESEHRGRAIAALPDGGALVAGDFVSGAGRQVCLARLTENGDVRWIRSVGASTDTTMVRGVAQHAAGGFILAGSVQHGAAKTHAWVAAVDGDGSLMWERDLSLSAGMSQ